MPASPGRGPPGAEPELRAASVRAAVRQTATVTTAAASQTRGIKRSNMTAVTLIPARAAGFGVCPCSGGDDY